MQQIEKIESHFTEVVYQLADLAMNNEYDKAYEILEVMQDFIADMKADIIALKKMNLQSEQNQTAQAAGSSKLDTANCVFHDF